jgi:hypothetical protein
MLWFGVSSCILFVGFGLRVYPRSYGALFCHLLKPFKLPICRVGKILIEGD